MHFFSSKATKTTCVEEGVVESLKMGLCGGGMVPAVMGMCLTGHWVPLCLADKQSLFLWLWKQDSIFFCQFKNCGQMILLKKTQTHIHPPKPSQTKLE